MQLQISNLPATVTVEDIKDLFGPLPDIEHICTTNQGNPENVIAWVTLNAGRAEVNAVANHVNNMFWKGRHLQAYAPLFFH